jgi:LPS O-antigen subunit length determinant protein (WzzB/FepE family)
MNTQPFFDETATLSRPMQQRLQTRVAQLGGKVEHVLEDVRAELARLDATSETQSDTDRQQFQSQRALLIAQIDYLTKLGVRQRVEEPSRSQNFWARFRRRSSRTPAAR